ncbi:hypothetical protein BJ878DRAFT_167374 [Calycina marina]|uniref:DUF7598 domain-containing protein n=1 Tax=Calycina marina TaxID=1763456 RepID=A0A9P7YYV7_9HELO|nr:hypothetical protein BJ878DRAFT_167374 [Calycina marina]
MFLLLKLGRKMFKLASNKNEQPSSSLRGPGYVVLNVIRVLNIISLIVVVVASWVMLVKTVMASNFFFFDGVSHFITSTIAIFLILSETSLFPNYFATTWPLLSTSSGFVFLGLSMLGLGLNILGNLNKPATSQSALGLPFWRIVIASGILSSILGFTNLIATFFFSDSKHGITGRQVRSHGALSPSTSQNKAISPRGSSYGGSDKAFTMSSASSSSRPLRPQSPEELPIYHQQAAPEDRRKSLFGMKLPVRMSQISRPFATNPDQVSQFNKFASRSSPVVPEVQRPPTALHPYHNVGRNDAPQRHQYPASSRYSVASDITRF